MQRDPRWRSVRSTAIHDGRHIRVQPRDFATSRHVGKRPSGESRTDSSAISGLGLDIGPHGNNLAPSSFLQPTSSPSVAAGDADLADVHACHHAVDAAFLCRRHLCSNTCESDE
jgi:hypothetical protein